MYFCHYRHPGEAEFRTVGDYHDQNGNVELALRYYSLGLHFDPYNDEIRSRIDSMIKEHGKESVSMCKWRGNIFTQTHEATTSLGMVSALQNRVHESMIFFFASVHSIFLYGYSSNYINVPLLHLCVHFE